MYRQLNFHSFYLLLYKLFGIFKSKEGGSEGVSLLNSQFGGDGRGPPIKLGGVAVRLVDEGVKVRQLHLHRSQQVVATNLIKGVPEIHFQERLGGAVTCDKVRPCCVGPRLRSTPNSYSQLLGRKAP